MALILLMGLPGAGKSTLRHRLQTAHPDLIESTSFDDFRIIQPCSAEPREARKQFELHVENMIMEKVGNSKICLIEDIFYMKSMRRPFRKISKRCLVDFGVVFLKLSIEEAFRRNSIRIPDKKQKEEVISKIFENLEMESDFLVLEQNEEIGLKEILKKLGIDLEKKTRIEKNFAEIERRKIRIPTPTPSESLPLQDFDVLTRRLVSEIIQNDRSIDGRKMSVARTKLISDEYNIDLNYSELKLKLLDIYDKQV